jgi:hypothetical protein
MYGSSWQDELSFDANLARNILELTDFCARARQERLHGFILEARSEQIGTSLEDTRMIMHAIMSRLARADESARRSLTAGDIEQIGWQFIFAGERLFTSLFARCYPMPHTKHLRDARVVVLFFQPEFSFDFCHITRRNVAAKEAIRRVFESAGRPYDWRLIERRVESHIYMSPLRIGEEPVRWWLPAGRYKC